MKTDCLYKKILVFLVVNLVLIAAGYKERAYDGSKNSDDEVDDSFPINLFHFKTILSSKYISNYSILFISLLYIYFKVKFTRRR